MSKVASSLRALVLFGLAAASVAVLALQPAAAGSLDGSWYADSCFYRSVLGGAERDGCREMVTDRDGIQWLAYYDDQGVYAFKVLEPNLHLDDLSPLTIRSRAFQLVAQNRPDLAVVLHPNDSPTNYCPVALSCVDPHTCQEDIECVRHKFLRD